jgi:hypothetical protein
MLKDRLQLRAARLVPQLALMLAQSGREGVLTKSMQYWP